MKCIGGDENLPNHCPNPEDQEPLLNRRQKWDRDLFSKQQQTNTGQRIGRMDVSEATGVLVNGGNR